MSSQEFEAKLGFGLAGESVIARFLRGRGNAVLPAYEKIIDTGKGPRLFMPNGVLVAPDFLVWKGMRALWIEAKSKTAFTWYRIGERWTTGIDLRHYRDYLNVAYQSPFPIWVLFLQGFGTAKDSPPNMPLPQPGLYGNDLLYLRDHESHQSDNWGKSGMVYWSVDDLRLVARYDGIE